MTVAEIRMLPVLGSIDRVVENKDGLYEGDMIEYFQIVWKARNVNEPYHNVRHMFHVAWLCYSALFYYREKGTPVSKIVGRKLMIEALFHDYDHTGRTGNDDLNIEFACRGVRKHLLPQDKSFEFEVCQSIQQATQFPYVVSAEKLSLIEKILRDADKSQAFSVAWIHQVCYGLALEMGITPLEVLRSQKGFLGQLEFSSEWGQAMFHDQIAAKIAEAERILYLLEFRRE